MTTSAAENLAGRPAIEKKEEKVEKRRALGRGLESLLPGPRVVVSPESRVPSVERGSDEASTVGSGGGGEQQVPRFARNDKTSGEHPSEEMDASRPEPALSLAKGVSTLRGNR